MYLVLCHVCCYYYYLLPGTEKSLHTSIIISHNAVRSTLYATHFRIFFIVHAIKVTRTKHIISVKIKCQFRSYYFLIIFFALVICGYSRNEWCGVKRLYFLCFSFPRQFLASASLLHSRIHRNDDKKIEDVFRHA